MDKQPDEIEPETTKLIASGDVTAKRKYFFPSTGLSIEGETLAEAVAEHEKLNNVEADDK